MFPLRVKTVTLIALVISSSSTASAQLLPERLVPPQQFSIPPLATTEHPAIRRPAGADKIPAHLWSLPVGAFPGAPTALSAERLPADWRRPVIDVPALASETDPFRPASPRQPVAGNTFGLGADPWKAAALDRFHRFSEPGASLADDPTAMSAHWLITIAVPLAAPNAAPLLRLGVADPFEHLRAIRLAIPQPDFDTPDAARETPPRPTLSVAMPQK